MRSTLKLAPRSIADGGNVGRPGSPSLATFARGSPGMTRLGSGTTVNHLLDSTHNKNYVYG